MPQDIHAALRPDQGTLGNSTSLEMLPTSMRHRITLVRSQMADLGCEDEALPKQPRKHG